MGLSVELVVHFNPSNDLGYVIFALQTFDDLTGADPILMFMYFADTWPFYRKYVKLW